MTYYKGVPLKDVPREKLEANFLRSYDLLCATRAELHQERRNTWNALDMSAQYETDMKRWRTRAYCWCTACLLAGAGAVAAVVGLGG